MTRWGSSRRVLQFVFELLTDDTTALIRLKKVLALLVDTESQWYVVVGVKVSSLLAMILNPAFVFFRSRDSSPTIRSRTVCPYRAWKVSSVLRGNDYCLRKSCQDRVVSYLLSFHPQWSRQRSLPSFPSPVYVRCGTFLRLVL